MRKTKLHKNQPHGKNHGKTSIKKQTVQQFSENMPPKLNHPTSPKQTQKLHTHLALLEKDA
jgi:hypothetical protein